MEKYGYKSITNRDEISKAANKNKSISPSTKGVKYENEFVSWSKQKDFGLPGQTRNHIMNMKEFMGKAEGVSKDIQKERKSTKFVAW